MIKAFKNKTIDHILLSIAPAALLDAENLLSRGNLLSFNMLDKGVWVGIFQESSTVETELWMAASKVRDIQCDCSIFKSENWCLHATAVLAYLKEQRKKNSRSGALDDDSASPVRSKEHHKITVRHLLRYIETEDLHNFILDFARQDKKFEMYFKTHFLTNVKLTEDDRRYEDLVQEILKYSIASTPSQKISTRQIQQFSQAVDKLTEQANLLLEAYNFRETFIILQVLTQRVMPALLRFSSTPQSHKSLKKLETLFIELAQAYISPELSDQFSQLVFQVLDQYDYRPASASGNLWQLWDPLKPLPASFSLLRSEAESYDSAAIAIGTLLHIDPEYIENRSIQKKWSLPGWDLFLETLQHLQSLEKNASQVLHLMQLYLPVFLYEKALVMLFKRDASIARSAKVIPAFVSLFLKNGAVELFEPLGQKERLRMLQQVRKSCQSAEDFYKFFAAVNSLKRIDLIDEEIRQELDFVRLFGIVQFLSKDQYKVIQDHVFPIIEQHLEDHMGPVNSEKVAFILSNISLKSDPKSFKLLKDSVLKKFGKRVSLREVLQ